MSFWAKDFSGLPKGPPAGSGLGPVRAPPGAVSPHELLVPFALCVMGRTESEGNRMDAGLPAPRGARPKW